MFQVAELVEATSIAFDKLRYHWTNYFQQKWGFYWQISIFSLYYKINVSFNLLNIAVNLFVN